jgi:hypothetical protein
MINYSVINKSKPKTLLFIHGLFSTSGYWLPYLKYFRDHRLLILNIDYSNMGFDAYVGAVNDIVATEAGGKLGAVISHSLGTLLSGRLPKDVCEASFEICPVYCAQRRNTDDFITEIERKMKGPMLRDEIWRLLGGVDSALANFDYAEQSAPGQVIYLPTEDPYFSYHIQTEAKVFHGDHFDILEAVIDIAKVLSE